MTETQVDSALAAVAQLVSVDHTRAQRQVWSTLLPSWSPYEMMVGTTKAMLLAYRGSPAILSLASAQCLRMTSYMKWINYYLLNISNTKFM